MFIIEDDFHAEHVITGLDSFDEAMRPLRDWSEIKWGKPPHQPPCADSLDCHRAYHIVEFDDLRIPWRELSRVVALEMSESGARWLRDDE